MVRSATYGDSASDSQYHLKPCLRTCGYASKLSKFLMVSAAAGCEHSGTGTTSNRRAGMPSVYQYNEVRPPEPCATSSARSGWRPQPYEEARMIQRRTTPIRDASSWQIPDFGRANAREVDPSWRTRRGRGMRRSRSARTCCAWRSLAMRPGDGEAPDQPLELSNMQQLPWRSDL